MVHTDPTIVHLTIDGETVETTPEHPFYVMDSAPWLQTGETQGRWVDAGELQVGDAVRQADGTTGMVQAVVVVQRSQPMYNLTVAVAHTFFVGAQQWLVHNRNCFDGPVKFTGLIRNQNLRDLTPNQLYNAFKKLGFNPSSHFLKRLRDERTQRLGFDTLQEIEKIFNKGEFIDQGNGTGALVFDGMAVIYNLVTGRLITLTPW